MKVVVTGANGFVGKNLCLALSKIDGIEIFRFDLDNTKAELEAWLNDCDFLFHLAGVNRPTDESEFTTGNTVFTEDVLGILEKRPVPVLLSSSIQASLENPYGESKLAAENAVRAYGEKTGAKVFVFRLANVFGKWCRPNYNSAVATWCHNRAHNLDIMVRDRSAEVNLVYIDDVVDAFIKCMNCEKEPILPFMSVEPCYKKTLGEIVDLIEDFRNEPQTLEVPDQRDGFSKKLYSTFLSYLPENEFSYPLTMHCDNRGSFTEVLHTLERGQVSINISKPNITKGQHWHHTKHEKFLVVSGTGVIRFRKMDDSSAKVISYNVSGEKLEVVRIPPGYTHNIENTGSSDMVTLMWANEVFDPSKPDTFREDV
ncbi:MAG: NAD-dependent epimerase/dehydratase family protein [Kiritimatiellae bacterium]|nr:NAD-dependent epimerase/dehydratase family protein [Kiritimatiellia bacterium]